jgi:hypothetical protein
MWRPKAARCAGPMYSVIRHRAAVAMIGLPVSKESPIVATESRFVSPAPYIVSFDIVLPS